MTTAVEINCETGIVTERPLTAAEIVANEAAAAEAAAAAHEEEAAAAEVAATKEAAHAKLAALGLTADEIAALSK
jgi:hypothetical protein